MRAADARAAARIDTLVNTHANGDHCYGNQLVPGAEIIASNAAPEEMEELPPAALAALIEGDADDPSPLGAFFRARFGPFEFGGIEPHAADADLRGRAVELRVGDKRVELIEVGPAHTRGDVLVHVARRPRRLHRRHPLHRRHADHVGRAGAELDRRLRADRGDGRRRGRARARSDHRPARRRGRARLPRVRPRRGAQRYDAGMDAFDAAQDIALGDYADWGDAERIVVNVDRLYREFSGDDGAPEVARRSSRRMAELARR